MLLGKSVSVTRRGYCQIGPGRMQGFFFDLSITIFAMPNTSKTKPVLVIMVAIVAAGIVALYLSRQGTNAETKDAAASSSTSTPVTSPGGGRIRGAADAPVTLTEYGDYQCPTCGLYHPIVNELLSRYQGKLKLEFHHFPLVTAHPNAMAAALAAEAAGDQGKFWEMNDIIFEHQNDWSRSPAAQTIFLQYALQIGLDSNRFMQAMKSPETQERVLADVRRGNDIVKGTPTFLVNGTVIPDLPNLEGLSDLIAGQLKALGK
jgi:protein-disulfide isomerase